MKQMKFMAPVLVGLLVVGCGDDSDGESGTEEQAVSITFAAKVGTEDVSCGTAYTGLGTTGSGLEFEDFRFYVQDVALIDADGNEVPVTLTNDGKWQNDSVALLDFEDKSGSCSNGTTDLNNKVVGTVPAGDYTGLVFSLGVPPELNHAEAAVAESPLNLTSMFWSWQNGYKFIRIDAKGVDGAPGWRLHLGSTACASIEEAADGESACGNLNVPRLTFDAFDASTQSVVFDLAALVAGADLENQEAGCMSDPTDADCATIFPAIGLEHSGNAATMSAFRVE